MKTNKIKEKVLKEIRKDPYYPYGNLDDLLEKSIDLTLAEIIRRIRGYTEYRGGMGNRIDAWDIINLIEGNKPEVDKFIEKELKKQKEK